jgi:hypothetical protein
LIKPFEKAAIGNHGGNLELDPAFCWQAVYSCLDSLICFRNPKLSPRPISRIWVSQVSEPRRSLPWRSPCWLRSSHSTVIGIRREYWQHCASFPIRTKARCPILRCEVLEIPMPFPIPTSASAQPQLSVGAQFPRQISCASSRGSDLGARMPPCTCGRRRRTLEDRFVRVLGDRQKGWLRR